MYFILTCIFVTAVPVSTHSGTIISHQRTQSLPLTDHPPTAPFSDNTMHQRGNGTGVKRPNQSGNKCMYLLGCCWDVRHIQISDLQRFTDLMYKIWKLIHLIKIMRNYRRNSLNIPLSYKRQMIYILHLHIFWHGNLFPGFRLFVKKIITLSYVSLLSFLTILKFIKSVEKCSQHFHK